MKWGDIITDTTKIQRIVREYFEKLYSNKSENLELIEKFQAHMYNSNKPRRYINSLKRSTTSNNVKTITVPQTK
jgi:hypothetical protein